MKRLLFFLFLLSLSTNAQLFLEQDYSQSSSSLDWEMIENDHVKLIYPKSLGNDSEYIANLIEYYSKDVGLTYGIKDPKKVPIIIRTEVAQPNGFVTLSPRRSEWFSASQFSTRLGSSEWYQTLSIHEYRHVQQFDNLNRSTIKFLSWIFGDFGQLIGTFSGVEPWYLEGDAVWSETKYTDAGRGRSPHFLSRLKAMLTSDQIPTYDELINGSYNTLLPNHYPFGFVLVSNATRKFGDDFWKRVTDKIVHFPHPYKLYTAFKEVSGQSFYDFYDETMNELRASWKKDIKEKALAKVDYRDNLSPFKVGNKTYYLNYTLDSFWTLYKKENGNKVKIAEIPFTKGMSKIDIRNNYAIYSQFLPHARFGHKGSSDLILINLESGEKTKITSGLRLYNPRFSLDGKTLYATEFNEDLKWTLSTFNLNGKKLSSVGFGVETIVEAYPINSNEVIAILADPAGYKFLAKVNLEKRTKKTILAKSRNNISSVFVDENKNTFFEAQYHGVTNIFKFTNKGNLQKCSNVDINATSPFADRKNLYYSSEDAYGSHISVTPLEKCQNFNVSNLVNFKYLGDNPSDSYNKFTLRPIEDQAKLRTNPTKHYEKHEYGDLDKGVIVPHSWSFFAGNGFGLSLTTDNYLRTLGIFAQVGKDGSEDQNYSLFNISFKKYYPIFNISGEIRNREVDFFNSEQTLTWKEKQVGSSMTLPYFHKKNLYNLISAVTVGGRYVDTRDYEAISTRPTYDNRYFLNTYAEFYFNLSKDLTARSIMSPWAISYFAKYENAKGNNEKRDSSYKLYQYGKIQTPGIFKHDAFRFTFSEEKQRNDINSYRFLPMLMNPTENVFSRGYEYESVPHYQKITANYAFPLATPDFDIWGLYYLRRLTVNTFFDSTKIESNSLNTTFNSTGLELEFESVFLRKIPINFGVRYAHKLKFKSNVGELYLATSLAF